MQRSIRAILFDLDGTLIDSAPDLGAAADQMRVARGMPSLPMADYRPYAGSGARGMLRVAFGMQPEDAEFPTMREEFFQNYERRMTQDTTVFDGVSDMLASIVARQLHWGVVTNKSKRFTEPLSRQMALFASAGAVVSGDTTPHAKPHPEPLFEAARRIGVDPQDCVYVGDDERDIIAGKAAGMHTVAAVYGYLGEKQSVAHWEADDVINSPHELLKRLNLA
ncbi:MULTISPECIES: HAD-IA family hydrolase [Comamonas]|jgi:2-phosphoglycolate phosphatase|uniref:HAD-IA family hydrolase n=1 Tax=Comamonas squillarum TaxID=2977320 RepID=A0ABY6A514_9BURK|nr:MULTISPECIES: HAD-IA family hydrolase [Comamonas]PWB21371.1 phosphoglycolate phosphatase [Comamonas sp. JNW]UXC20070.1 HAD-IA family hydrolase [Comamonas sp. PR12]